MINTPAVTVCEDSAQLRYQHRWGLWTSSLSKPRTLDISLKLTPWTTPRTSRCCCRPCTRGNSRCRPGGMWRYFGSNDAYGDWGEMPHFSLCTREMGSRVLQQRYLPTYTLSNTDST